MDHELRKRGASARNITKHFGATRALDDVSFDVMRARSTRWSARTAPASRRSCASWAACIGRTAAWSRSTASRVTSRARAMRSRRASSRSRRSCAWCRRCRSPRTSCSAICRCDWLGVLPVVDRARMREQARAHLAAARFRARSGSARRSPELRRAAARRHRQGAAAASAASSSSTSRPRRWRSREIERLFAVLARMKAAGHRDHLCLASARRGGGARRPLHRAARRPRRRGRAARRVQRRRPGAGDDRPRASRRRSRERDRARRRCCWRRPTRSTTRCACARGEVDRPRRVCSAAAPTAMLRRLFGVRTRRRATCASTPSRGASTTPRIRALPPASAWCRASAGSA